MAWISEVIWDSSLRGGDLLDYLIAQSVLPKRKRLQRNLSARSSAVAECRVSMNTKHQGATEDRSSIVAQHLYQKAYVWKYNHSIRLKEKRFPC